MAALAAGALKYVSVQRQGSHEWQAVHVVVDLGCFVPEWPSSATVAELSRRHIYIPLQARTLIPLRLLLQVFL